MCRDKREGSRYKIITGCAIQYMKEAGVSLPRKLTHVHFLNANSLRLPVPASTTSSAI